MAGPDFEISCEAKVAISNIDNAVLPNTLGKLDCPIVCVFQKRFVGKREEVFRDIVDFKVNNCIRLIIPKQP